MWMQTVENIRTLPLGNAASSSLEKETERGTALVGVGIEVSDLNAWYGANHTLKDINLRIPANHVTALIGPSGCGKSTFVRCLNRMHETNPVGRVTGTVRIGEVDIYNGSSAVEIRRRVGMVFQRPNPFPTMSIYDNVASGLRLNGYRNRGVLDGVVQHSLERAALWGEVKDDLRKKSGASLSGGQQQRLCIARALAVDPEVMLMDEPASALDPVSTAKIEDLIFQLEIRIHHCDRDPQHAAGGACCGEYRLLLEWQTGRVRFHPQDLYQPSGQAHRRLHHRQVWMTRIRFHLKLDDLKERLLVMAGMAEQAIQRSVEAYRVRDLSICDLVDRSEVAINGFEREIDQMALDLLAMEQPMAIDLRFILAVIKINADLERVGDQAVSISDRVRDLQAFPIVDLPVDIQRMAHLASAMVRKALQGFIEGDAEVANSVLTMDDNVDKLNHTAFIALSNLIEQQPQWTPQALNALMIARNLERVADHATNIAEDVIFCVRGADVRHNLTA